MKRVILCTVIFLSFFLSANAQSIPYGMKYQAVARDISGNVLAEQKISLKITLYSQEDRKIQYSETHSKTTSILGLFSLTVGEGISEVGTFSEVPWSTENIWMELAIDESGGNNYVTINDSKLLAVPYAFHAATATKIAGKESGDENSRSLNRGEAWVVGGNEFIDFGSPNSGPHTLGTLKTHDLVLITNNETAMTISGRDGNIQVHNDLTVDGATYLNSSLDVNNESPTNLTGTLNVDGVTSINNALDVTNDGATYLSGTLDVDGITNVNAAFNVNKVRPSHLSGTLEVEGVTDLNSDFNVNEESPSDLSGTLDVDGITSLKNTTESTSSSNGALRVSGGVGISKKLNVAGEARLEETLSVGITSPPSMNGHVAHFENTNTGESPNTKDNNGIQIKLGATTPHNSNNFITFLNGNNSIVGRIEGEDGEDDYQANREYQDDIIFKGFDIALIYTDIAIFTAETLLAAGKSAAAATSSTTCAGAGACVTTPIPSLIGISLTEIIVAAANLALKVVDLGVAIAAEATFVETHKALKGVTFASGSEDYAEYLPKVNPAEDYLPGEVVGLKNGFISRNTLDADRIMVISFKPAVLGGLPEVGEEDKYEKVAFLGQIPTRVIGKVAPGDYILPSGYHNGFATAKHPDEMLLSDYKKILGVAWDRSGEQAYSMINVAVGLNVNDLSDVVQKQQEELGSLKKQMAQTNNVLAELVPGFKEATHFEQEFASAPIAGNTPHDHDHDHKPTIITQNDVEMVRPDESTIIYYVPQREEYLQAIESARNLYLETGGKIEDHPFWNRMEKDADFMEEVINETRIKFDKAIHYHADVNSGER